MAEIAPLTPLCYALHASLERLVAPPYDVISPELRAELAASDPNNVVHLILPEGEGDTRYERAASHLAKMRASGSLVRDDEPGYFRYDQTFSAPSAPPGAPKLTRTGFLAAVRLSPFSDRVVLPHERTLSGPKVDRLKLFRSTRTNLSPGFMLYRDPERTLDEPLSLARALAEFTTSDGVLHRLSKVTDPAALRAITRRVAESSLLIADGHHRYETAVAYAAELAAANPDAPARAEFRYFMTFLSNGDDPNLVVFPTHRHAHDLPGFSFDALLAGASARGLFAVTDLGSGASADALLDRLKGAGEQGPCFVACAKDGRAALLALRPTADLANHPTLGKQVEPLRRSDVALLHGAVLEDLCGITQEAQAAKTNLYYVQDAGQALAEVRGGRGDVLFLMNATPTRVVRAIAESGEVMPQKSTFFYPKVLTGLAIHTLEPGRTVPEVL